MAPLQGAKLKQLLTGGLRFAATSGYSLATLWVADSLPPKKTAARNLWYKFAKHGMPVPGLLLPEAA
jgi:hypothetical protein